MEIARTAYSKIYDFQQPENVLCISKQGNRIKLIDFGFARLYDPNNKLQVMFGSAEYSAPEVVTFDEIGCYTGESFVNLRIRRMYLRLH